MALPLVMAASMGVGPLLHYSLSALGPVVTDDLGLSRTHLGLIATSTFAVAGLTSRMAGRLVDREPQPRVVAALYLLASASLVLAGTLGTFAAILAAAALSGLAQALSNPVTNGILAARPWSPNLGLLVGTKQSGVQGAQLLAGAALPSLAILLGWRGAVAVLGVLVLVSTPLVFRTVRRHAVGTPVDRRPAADDGTPTPIALFAGYTLLTGAGLQATNAYLPLYSYEQLSLGLASAGWTVGVAGALGVVSRAVWGRVAQRSAHLLRLLVAMGLASGLGAVAILWAGRGGQVWAVWAGAAAHGGIAVAANVVVIMALMRSTPPGRIGRATGVVGLGMFSGFALGPWVFGWLSDTASYEVAWTFVAASHVAAAAWATVLGRAARRRRAGNPVPPPSAHPR